MVAVINLGSSKTSFISEVLTQKGINNEILSERDFTVADFASYQALILSGSPVLLSEIPGSQYNSYLIRYDFIKHLSIPVLGICFGHQLIGILHGGRIGKCQPDRDWQTIQKLADHEVLAGFDKEFRMKEDHQEHVTVPPYFIHLGSSVICENEAMAHPTKKMISVQFHPEVSEESGSRFFDQIIQYFAL